MQSISQERSSSRGTPLLEIPDKEQLFEKLKKIPKSRIVFITIRDPKQRYTMNKAINWIGKHTEVLCIVRGEVGGEHYHLVAGLRANDPWTPRCSKGVHFNIQYLNAKTREPFDPVIVEDARRSAHIAETIRNNNIIKYEIPYVCVKISRMIQDYFRKKTARATRIEVKNEKEKHIMRVIEYLERNLNENDDIVTYTTYYYKQYVR